MLPPISAGINHGVCIEPRCACADALRRQLAELGIRAEMQKHSKSALEGAQRTIRRALEHARPGELVLYIEDDARLAPDASERLEELLYWITGRIGVLFLFSAREEPPPPPDMPSVPQRLEYDSRPVAGAVAVLLSRAAAELATLEAHRVTSGVPVERLFVNVGKVHGDATVWPSLVDRRGELESVHRPGSGGQGTYSPSFGARYYAAIRHAAEPPVSEDDFVPNR